MMESALVTGATGFIGRHLVRRLMADRVPLRVLVRNPDVLDDRVRRHTDVVQADIRDRVRLREATEGMHTVFHLAACARAWSRDRREFHAVNVDAVESLLEAAYDSDVQRIVHASTVLTLPPYRKAPGRIGARDLTPYERTKRAGEALVASYAAGGRHAVIVHPTRVYGPGPLNDANAMTRVIALYMAGRFRVRIADGDVLANYVHVEDVAIGLQLAAERGHTGAHYPLGGPDNVSLRGFLALVAELGGKPYGTLAVPRVAALAAAHMEKLKGRLGGQASLTPEWIRVFLEDRRVDIGPSRRDLAYRPRPLRRGLRETIGWLRDNGR